MTNNCRYSQTSVNSALFTGRIGLPALIIITICFITATAGQARADDQGKGAADSVKLEDVQEELSAAIASLKGYSISQREVAVEKAGATLDELDKQIEVLRQRTANDWGSLSVEAREARLTALKNLTRQRNDLAEWYGGMKYSSSQAWNEVREGFVDAYEVLQNAWTDALGEFD